MPTLKLFYSTSSNDSENLKTFFDEVTINDDVVVNTNQPLNTKATFISYNLDLPENHPGKVSYIGEGVTSPLLRVEADVVTEWVGNSSGSNDSVDPDTLVNTKAGDREDITNLEGLNNADVLYEVISESSQ